MRRGVCLQFTVYGLQMITRMNGKSARKVIARMNGKSTRKGVRGILLPLTSHLLPLTSYNSLILHIVAKGCRKGGAVAVDLSRLYRGDDPR